MPATPPSKQFASAPFIAELARERRNSQLEEIDALDSKAAGMLGFAAVVLGLLFTSDLATDRWNSVLTFAAVCLAGSLVPLVAALWPRKYRFNPEIGALKRLALHKDPEFTAAVTVESVERAILHNQAILRRKAWATRLGTALLVAGVLIASGRLVYSVDKESTNESSSAIETKQADQGR